MVIGQFGGFYVEVKPNQCFPFKSVTMQPLLFIFKCIFTHLLGVNLDSKLLAFMVMVSVNSTSFAGDAKASE